LHAGFYIKINKKKAERKREGGLEGTKPTFQKHWKQKSSEKSLVNSEGREGWGGILTLKQGGACRKGKEALFACRTL